VSPMLATMPSASTGSAALGHSVMSRSAWGRPVITEARVAVEWWTTMIDPRESKITLPGCLLLRFAPDGRCQDLWKYWQVQPGMQDPPGG
jgi:hypothetical protein